jgi:hypothetical protein
VARVRDHVIYQAGGVLLLRAAARPLDSALAPWPDPADSEQLRAWLVKAWQDPVLREAVASASPPLALRANRVGAGQGVPARQVRSAAVALARYQLRAAGRPTPFGLFAGVAEARLGGPASEAGRLLSAAHALLRDQVACSTPLIDECVSRVLAAGAYGAKLSGSGHGGCLFALVPDDAVAPVLASVAGLPVHAVALPRSDPSGLACAPPAARQDAARPA